VRQQCEEHHSEQYQNFKPDERAVIPLAQGRTALLDRKILQDQQILDLRKSLRRNMETMRAARIYGYNQPLVLEEIETPKIAPGEVLVKVGSGRYVKGISKTVFS
jgi:prefoldin subunit 5